jgi:hypothetical protein
MALAAEPAQPLAVLRADGAAPSPTDLTALDGVFSLPPGTSRPAQLAPAVGAWIPLGTTLQPCASAPGALAAAISEARGLLSQLQEADAIDILRNAVASAPCGVDTVERPVLGAALDLLGQAAQDGQKEAVARDAYVRLLAIDPAWRLQSPPGTGYETLWNAVRREVLARPTATFALWHQGEVRVDGEVIPKESAATLSLAAGPHWVQWREDNGWKGMWLQLGSGVSAGLVATPTREGLLRAGPSGAGTRLLLTALLDRLAQEQGAAGAAVIEQTHDAGRSGYVVRAGALEAWAESVETQARGVPSDRLRLGVGGGYLRLDQWNYGSVHTSVEVRLVGPLHVVVEGDVGLSQGVQLNNPELDERPSANGDVLTLPSIGAGALVRLQKGPIQPFIGATVGASLDPPALREPLVEQIASLDPDGTQTADDIAIAELRARPAAIFRVLLDGGVDLLPGGGRLVIRPHAGVGWNGGLLVRGGLLVGLRFGLDAARPGR